MIELIDHTTGLSIVLIGQNVNTFNTYEQAFKINILFIVYFIKSPEYQITCDPISNHIINNHQYTNPHFEGVVSKVRWSENLFTCTRCTQNKKLQKLHG